MRFCLPLVICAARAWMISGLLQEAVEVDQHQQRGTVGRAQGIQRANGGQRIVAAGIDAGRRPGGADRRPRSMSQTTSRQSSSRHIWAISVRASSCSWD